MKTTIFKVLEMDNEITKENGYAQRWKENKAHVFMEVKEVKDFKKGRWINKYFQSSTNFQSAKD